MSGYCKFVDEFFENVFLSDKIYFAEFLQNGEINVT